MEEYQGIKIVENKDWLRFRLV